MCSRSAARVTLPSSATATKYRMSRSSGCTLWRSYAARISTERTGLGHTPRIRGRLISTQPGHFRQEHLMSKLLYVISSPRGDQSESRAIADEFLRAYRRTDPRVEVDV